jgi:hypothetical protein
LGGPAFFTNSSVLSLTNRQRLPVGIIISCVVGAYSVPGTNCLCDVLVRSTNGGAVAMIGATGLSFDNEARLFNTRVAELLRTNAIRGVGDAFRRAMYDHITLDRPVKQPYIYNLLGDPAVSYNVVRDLAEACTYTTTNWFKLDIQGTVINLVMTYSNASGLSSVQALTLSNCTLQGTAYDGNGGILSPNPITPITLAARSDLPAGAVTLVLTATKVTDGQPAAVNAIVIDPCGLGKSFDPVITTLEVTSGNLVQQRFTGILAAEHYLHVANGAPGLKWLELNVNGHKFRLDPLPAGSALSADLSRAMLEGENNTVVLTGYGETGASAAVTITDTASAGLVPLIEVAELSIARTDGGVVVSWPDTLSGWQLQATSDLAGGWLDVTTKLLAMDGRVQATLPADQGPQFFRLRSLSGTSLAAAGSTTAGDGIKVAAPPTKASQPTTRTYDGILW